ncbi:CRISPR-associated endonuclease Cas2 (plasmid) [Roseomonas marmotae]|uniref:CRISPR-associated endonuclease Cas2 n=1 Tax=Roseomonas marmotae TaxID=2768161 RepID=UPI001AD7A46F|nr:CRISPR-associated endonuclease Cas2 [Roseomonas marmotae]QTI82157.1 CRISPR-associated endonuclease Cas2 [Roseomonas marmotae]
MYVLITYDVEARRTRRFHKLLSRYLVQEQNSVFGGEMTNATLLRLHRELAKIARDDDRVFQVIAENRHNVAVSLLCKSDTNATLRNVAHDHHIKNNMVL